VSDEDFYADIVGVTEVAENLGVGLPRVRRWIDRRESTGCPSPVRVLKSGHLYSMQAWRGWFALWRVTRGHETWRVNNVPDEQRTAKQR
jgi:hypothetical protein